jgi:hypothetical protein
MKMPWGKFKGEDIGDIPTSYIEWALGNLDLTDVLVEEMEAQLSARRGEGIARGRQEER